MNLQEILELRQPARFTCRAGWQSHESQEFFEVFVDHNEQTWRVNNLTTGIVAHYADGMLHHGPEITPSDNYRKRVTTTALQLIFPEKLPVWGRAGKDTDSPVNTESLSSDEVLVTCASLQDPSIRKTLVVNTGLGLVTRYNDSLTATLLFDVKDLNEV